MYMHVHVGQELQGCISFATERQEDILIWWNLNIFNVFILYVNSEGLHC